MPVCKDFNWQLIKSKQLAFVRKLLLSDTQNLFQGCKRLWAAFILLMYNCLRRANLLHLFLVLTNLFCRWMQSYSRVFQTFIHMAFESSFVDNTDTDTFLISHLKNGPSHFSSFWKNTKTFENPLTGPLFFIGGQLCAWEGFNRSQSSWLRDWEDTCRLTNEDK